jgi:hypothetical protein
MEEVLILIALKLILKMKIINRWEFFRLILHLILIKEILLIEMHVFQLINKALIIKIILV